MSIVGPTKKGFVNVHGLEPEQFLDDDMVLDQNGAIFFLGTIAVEIPAGSDGLFVEGTEEGLFDIVWDGHVILDRVEATENDIE